MERMSLQKDGATACVKRAADVLRAGGIILYPTDTIYGVGGDALSDEAFEKVCNIKERDVRRPVHAVFADMTMVAEYAEVNEMGRKLADALLPGPLTLVFDKKAHVETGIAHGLPTIGVRMPKNAFCLALAREFKRPYTTTSANKSGEQTPPTLDAIIEQLGKDAENVSLAIDGGELDSDMKSTVVDVRGSEPFILREGAISEEEIQEALLS